MRFTPTAKYLALSRGATKQIQRKVYVKLTTDLTEALSAGTWIDVTSRVLEDPASMFSIESDLFQFQSSPLSLVAHGVTWWENNILQYNGFVEVKIEYRVGHSDTNLATDILYKFSGLLDTAKPEQSEIPDTLTLPLYSYDDYGRRLSGESVVYQHLNEDVDGSGTDGLVLQNIPGIYVTDANVAGFTLLRGVHVITYEYNGGTEQAALDDGAFVTLPTSDGAATLENADSTQKVTIYVDVSEILTSGTATQDIIVSTLGATIPNVWYQRQWMFTLLKTLSAKFGITSYTFDNFSLPTFDGRNVTSHFEIPPGDSFYQRPQAIAYDETNNMIWLGVGDKIYRRSPTTHEYTSLGQVAAGYKVVRFFTEDIANGFVWGLAKDSSNAYRVFRVTISTDALSSYALTNRGTGDNLSTGCQNFAFAASYGTSGVIYFCATDASDKIWYFDLNTLAEVDTGVVLASAAQYTLAGWSDGTDYYCQRFAGIGTTYIMRVYDSAGWSYLTKNGGAATPEFEDGAYNATEGVFIFTQVGGNGVYSYSHAGDAISTIDGSGGAQCFTVSSGRVYFYRGNSAKTLAYINAGSLYTLTPAVTMPFSGDFVQKPNRIAYDPTLGRVLGLFERSNLLFQFGNRTSMFVDVEMDLQGQMVGDAIRELCVAFNAMFIVSSSKKTIAYRRGGDTGAPQTTGQQLTVTISNAQDVQRKVGYREKFDYTEISNGTITYSYDGTTFYPHAYPALGDQRPLQITSRYIPSAFVQDIAYFLFQHFRVAYDLWTIPMPNILQWQYEPFDGLVLNLTTNKLRKRGAGPIVQQGIMADGGNDLSALIPQGGQYDYAVYDGERYN